MFEPFFRVDKSRSRELGGVGLGLAFVREIVRVHDGSICIKSGKTGETIFEGDFCTVFDLAFHFTPFVNAIKTDFLYPAIYETAALTVRLSDLRNRFLTAKYNNLD